MFQGVWSSNHNQSQFKKIKNIPSDFISRDDIALVRVTYWDEHCLECSAPACYQSCPIYQKREDGACRRLEYGIRIRRPPEGLLWHAVLKFRKWGKLEARINKGSMEPEKLIAYDKHERLKANGLKTVSKLLFPTDYALSRKWDGLRRRKYSLTEPRAPFVSDFLFQCRYAGKLEKFNLLLEITDTNNVTIYKESLEISQGWNQKLLKIDFSLPEGGLVRMYPENNYEAEIEVFCADFVQLKKDIPTAPAGKLKCVAWDLDNTVWDGVLIESEPDQLVLKHNILDTIEELDKRGIIQIVVSKNDKSDVLPVLERLGIDQYFVSIYANWGPKSQSIYYAAKLLNIGVDTFALIDDQLFERTEVTETLKCVRAYCEEEIPELLQKAEFAVPVTEESAKRRESYLREIRRREVRDVFSGNNAGFIRSCQLKIRIETPKTPQQIQRSIELLQRTNQLNLSAHRYTAEEFYELLHRPDKIPLILYAEDRFGDYGQVAFLLFSVEKNIEITEYAMSCRVASKLVENALFSWMRSKYSGRGIRAVGIMTDRNGTLVDAWRRVGFTMTCENEKMELSLDNVVEIPDYDAVIVEDQIIDEN